MSPRLRLDPNAPEGGGGNPAEAPAPPPHPDLTRQPAAKGAEPRPDASRAEPASAWEAAREQERKELAELRKWKAEEDARREAAERERLIKAGDSEQLMTRYEAELKRRDEVAEAERRKYRESTLDRDLAVALAKFPWVDGAMDRVARLLRDELETVERDGRYHTIAKESMRPIEDHVRERVEKDPFFKHILRADGLRPGSDATNPSHGSGQPGGDGGDRPAPADPALNARKGFQAAGRILSNGGIRF